MIIYIDLRYLTNTKNKRLHQAFFISSLPVSHFKSLFPLFYDIIIIGAGVVGCAISRELSKYELKVLVIEKEDDVAGSTSKANSGVMHAGYHKAPGSLKAILNVAGHANFQRLSDELDFPIKFTGKLVVAKKEDEIEQLRQLMDRG